MLEAWDVRDDLSSQGAILFRRFATHALSGVLPVGGPPVSPYANGSTSPTPSTRRTASPPTSPRSAPPSPTPSRTCAARVSLLDAPLGEYQFAERNGERIPIHGGPGDPIGVFNAISARWNGDGFNPVDYGSSIVMVTSFTDGGCPDDRSILTYSLSTNPKSPYYADQTRMFSEKEWVDPPFCAREVREAEAVAKVQRLRVGR